MAAAPVNLYELLPALYRIRDEDLGAAERGVPVGHKDDEGEIVKGPLGQLLDLIESQVELLRGNIGELYDDFFIETCADWVIPYIGDLIGNKPLYDIARTRRADVARTLYYRQRKGTHLVIEELANDVTGWKAFVVPFFELLAWTQNVNHIRIDPAPASDMSPGYYERVGTVPVRNLDILDRMGGPFGGVTHTVDVRPMSSASGWYGPRKVGIFLWRLKSFLMSDVAARRTPNAAAHEYLFSPLANPLRLYRNPSATSPEELSTEANIPEPIRRVSFAASAAPYVDSRSIRIMRDGALVPAGTLLCMDLASWLVPPPDRVGVDVVKGRISFGAAVAPADPTSVVVDYNYGFHGETGGGPYARLAPMFSGEHVQKTAEYRIWNPERFRAQPFHVGAGQPFATIAAAVAAWAGAGRPASIIEITDNAIYDLAGALSVDLMGSRLIIRSSDGRRPTLIGDITLPNTSGAASLALSGLLIAGTIEIEGDLGRLTVAHCTLVPGRALTEAGEPAEPYAPSIRASAAATSLTVEIERSITGRLELPSILVGLSVADSIIDSPARDGRAVPASVLLSGNLNPMPALPYPARLRVAVASDPARTVTLDLVPATLAEARDRLQQAIRSSDPLDPSLQSVSVVIVGTRLAITTTTGAPVWIETEPGNGGAAALRLLAPDGRRMQSLLGGTLGAFAGFSDADPVLRVRIGEYPAADAAILGGPTTPATLRDQLQSAIRAAYAAPGFSGAYVALLNQRLLVIPGEEETPIAFAPGATPAALLEAALESARPAIAGTPAANDSAPTATLSRVTVLGTSFLREVELATDCIFTRPLRVERRQSGCIRFSYVPPGSNTPRRYRCQPDRAAEGLDAATQARVYAQLIPEFASDRYGEAAYAQLALHCAAEIARGGEDGGEMGAWHLLFNPMREANLRIRLDEYLPFGLDAALLYMS